MTNDELSLNYHEENRPGKIEVIPTKPCSTAMELSLAYTPGVAAPSMAISHNPEKVYNYSSKGNLVAVISNGTAVLGLGNIGPLASKPVMEGKGILFKKFADIDVFDIEINEEDPKKLVEVIKAISPTFGGINLEDIKAPECFYVEEELSKSLPIPVFHDDQHGTAIIAAAALINALEIVDKKIEDVKFAFSGAGAAAIACAKFFVTIGAKKEHIFLSDKSGVLYEGRGTFSDSQKDFVQKTDKRTLADAINGADVFLGLSAGNVVSEEMIMKMAKKPIIFALANPTPEIPYELAKKARPDAVVATGRSDYPNQVNNVLGFPFIFRGALDTRATEINDEMKTAASYAIAKLAKQRTPDSVCYAYGRNDFSFGPEYILPKPFDPRVLTAVSVAVADAATKSGVAQKPITDLLAYKYQLEQRINPARGALNSIYEEARRLKAKIVFPEGNSPRVLQAVQNLIQEEICQPILLGNKEEILKEAKKLNITLDNVEIIDHFVSPSLPQKAQKYFELRSRHGITTQEAKRRMQSRSYYAAMMVKNKEADGMVSGVTRAYPNAVRPILEIIGVKEDKRAMAMYMIAFKNSVKFFADTALHIEPSAEEIATIAIQTADRVKRDFGIEPNIAVLSFSNFGSVQHPEAIKAKKAVELVKSRRPDLTIDGEMQADVALDENKRKDYFPFSSLTENANIFVFSNLSAANNSYKLLEKLAPCEAVGPILIGVCKAASVCQLHASVPSIVHMAAITAVSTRHVPK